MNQLGTLRAYLFSDMLNVPSDQQGRLVGLLEPISEIPGLVLSAVFGAASDKVGRRTIYGLGFFFLAVSFFLFPFAKVGVSLFGLTILAALGTTCISTMLAAVIAEYPAERARGKLVGICFFLNGIGVATLVISMSRLPATFVASGATPFDAGKYTYWTAAALCLIPLVVVALGLARPPRGSSATDDSGPRPGLLGTLATGVRAARDKRIRLAYLSAAVTRASLSIVSGFFFLWLTNEGREQGMTTAEATAQAGKYFAAIQGTATIWAVIVIFFIDRFDRTLAMAIGAGLACASYTTMGLVDNPFQPAMFAAAVFLGIGEMSGVLASQSLIGQVAPEQGRGAVIGVFTLAGSVGIMVASYTGGYLFDIWRYSAPYLVMGVTSGILCLMAIYTYRTTR
jgi:MFS family permease